MKMLLLALGLLVPMALQADLLDRIKLEDSIRDRVEQTLRVADPNARALVRFEFKKYSETLPGSNVSSSQELVPNGIETEDVSKVWITAYSELQDFPAEISNSVYSIIPFARNKIALQIKKYPIAIKTVPNISSSDISDIADKSVRTLSQILGLFALLVGCLSVAFLYFQNKKKMNVFRDQIKAVASALSEGALGGSRNAQPLSLSNPESNSAPAYAGDSTTDSNLILHRLPISSVAELIADCYWTEQDEYAHWIWKNLQTSQQSELYLCFAKTREYSLYFVNRVPIQMSFHDHPYYLQPNQLMKISQVDLLTELKQDFARWHLISPLRQEFLPMDLKSKLKAVQTVSPAQGWAPQKTSEARKLKTLIRWGKISVQDEKDIFHSPEMIPSAFKANISSLVWLAHKETATIAQILNQFDARSLAEAWVGPEEVLRKLEQSLPEKKLKLLQTYRTKTTSSRSSPIYMALVQQGLKDEAA